MRAVCNNCGYSVEVEEGMLVIDVPSECPVCKLEYMGFEEEE